MRDRLRIGPASPASNSGRQALPSISRFASKDTVMCVYERQPPSASRELPLRLPVLVTCHVPYQGNWGQAR